MEAVRFVFFRIFSGGISFSGVFVYSANEGMVREGQKRREVERKKKLKK